MKRWIGMAVLFLVLPLMGQSCNAVTEEVVIVVDDPIVIDSAFDVGFTSDYIWLSKDHITYIAAQRFPDNGKLNIKVAGKVDLAGLKSYTSQATALGFNKS